MKYLMISCALLTSCSALCMEQAPEKRLSEKIKTSDQHTCELPQWQIEASRLLHTKQQFSAFKKRCSIQDLYPISLKTIDKEKLDLFSAALAAPQFGEYFKKLTRANQKTLINLSREKELDSPLLTILLATHHLGLDIVGQRICPQFHEIITMHNELKRSCIINNTLTDKYQPITSNYFENRCLSLKHDGGYRSIPIELLKCKYHGGGYPLHENFLLKNDRWRVMWIKAKNEHERYLITSTTPIAENHQSLSPNNQYNLWLKNKNHTADTAAIKKILHHTNEINRIIFTDDCHYLISTSYDNPNSTVMMTSLYETKDIPAFSDTFLETTGAIGALCCNNKSTVLAVGSQNGIQLWDLQKKSLLSTCGLPTNGIIVDGLEFNKDNTTLIATIPSDLYGYRHGYKIQLYNISDPSTTEKIAEFKIMMDRVKDVRFLSDINAFIITTTKNALIIDALSGELIMQTPDIPDNDAKFSLQVAVPIPDIDILATATITDEKYCDTRLWDMRSKKIIAMLLQDALCISGIGITPDNRSIIATDQNYNMTKINLYDDQFAQWLDWITKDTTLLQKYLLLLLHSRQSNESLKLNSGSLEEYLIGCCLPIEPCNTKKMVEQYLLTKEVVCKPFEKKEH